MDLLEGKCKTCDKGFVCAEGYRSYNHFKHSNRHKSNISPKIKKKIVQELNNVQIPV